MPLVVLAIQLASLSLEFLEKTPGLMFFFGVSSSSSVSRLLSLAALIQASFLHVIRMLLMETGMNLKNITIGLNVLLMLLCVGFFAGHGLPKSLMLWSSAILWFVAPIVNLLYIRKNS